MTGAITATTVALIGAAAVGAAGLGYTIAQGVEGQRRQADALRRQEGAQGQAVSAAEQQRLTSQMAMNKANQKRPDVSSIMQAASESASGGPQSTMLTGPTGVNPNTLSLGKTTLLGS